ncbi:MAG: type II toxin-antitoxin system VapC family toxin [Propionibacteriaceae bacterium]|nr:type II toxin-antitoxin system VapC family toxin [Propionibacteriaceae bacterium]
MTTAFDADVLIYAATPQHPLGRRVFALFDGRPAETAGVGSVLLTNEVLPKPLRANLESPQAAQLGWLLAGLELWPVSDQVSEYAVALAVKYGLTTVDAIHLATAILAGADRFLTNNRKDFDKQRIAEVAIVYPDDLPA